MTEQELAQQIFPKDREKSFSSTSIITAVALADSSDGEVSVRIDGAQLAGENKDLVVIPTTVSASAGDRLIVTLYGEDGHGKKAYVSGRIGGSGGGGGDIDELEARVATLEGTVSSLSSQVSSLSSTVSSHTTSISSLSSRLSTAEQNVSSLQSDMTSAQSDISTLQSDLSDLQSDLSSLQSTVSSHTTSISSLSSRLSTAEDDISDLQSDLSSLQSTVSGHTSSISSLSSRLSTAETKISTMQNQISSLQSTLSSLQSTVSGHTTSISSLSSRLSTAESDISDLDDRVTALEQGGSLPALEQRVSSLETWQTDAESDISSLQSDMTTSKSKINSMVYVLNDRGFMRLYRWTGGGNSQASLWYQPMSGLVLLCMRADSTWTSGNSYFNSSSPIPSNLRPGSFGSLPSQVNQVVRGGNNPMMFFVLADGTVGGNVASTSPRNDWGTLTWLAKADLAYMSSISSVDSSISPLSVTRAYAARVALGDGLDVTEEEFKKTEKFYDEAYDVIFSDDASSEER